MIPGCSWLRKCSRVHLLGAKLLVWPIATVVLEAVQGHMQSCPTVSWVFAVKNKEKSG